MKKLTKSILSLFSAVVVLSSVMASAKSYTYNSKGKPVSTPEAATVVTLVDDSYAGWGSLNSPEDIMVADNGEVYIADTAHARIVHLDKNYKFVEEIKVLKEKDGTEVTLKGPKGVFYHAFLKELYIADPDSNYVFVVDDENNIKRKLYATSEETFKENFLFLPNKVAVDYAGRVFVVAANVYDGLMEFDIQGKFVGYSGANKVTPSASDIFWRTFATEEARSKMQKLIPVEFDNIDVDEDGFIYTVTKAVKSIYDPAASNPIRKQTVQGVNKLRAGSLGVPIGDVEYPFNNATDSGPSRIIDISVNDDYGYSVIDERRQRIFVYNHAGEILFVLGGEGDTKGYFETPIAIESYGDNIAVLDKSSGTVTVFAFTEYGKLVIDAENAYLEGRYDDSIAGWNAVLKKNSALDIAYVGIGKVLIVKSEYQEAMKYLKLGGDRTYYSQAYTAFRKDFITKNIYTMLGIAAVIAVLIFLYFKFLHKKVKEKNRFRDKDWYKGLKFSKHIMFHPFDGFWDMQHENKGKVSSALIIYALFAATLIFKAQFTGYAFGGEGRFNIITVVGTAIVPAFLWCVCNWAVTTLFDGDGSPKAIMMATAYSLVPYIIAEIPLTILTNFLSAEEKPLINVITILAIAWCVFLLFCGMLTIHQYGIGQTILTIIVSVVAIFAVLFLIILFYNLLQQMIIFVISMYNEVIVRM